MEENQHRRQAQHHARNTEQLFLALRELAARFADDRVVAVRQTLDKAVRVAGLGGGDDFLICRVRFAHGDVVTDRS